MIMVVLTAAFLFFFIHRRPVKLSVSVWKGSGRFRSISSIWFPEYWWLTDFCLAYYTCLKRHHIDAPFFFKINGSACNVMYIFEQKNIWHLFQHQILHLTLYNNENKIRSRNSIKLLFESNAHIQKTYRIINFHYKKN